MFRIEPNNQRKLTECVTADDLVDFFLLVSGFRGEQIENARQPLNIAFQRMADAIDPINKGCHQTQPFFAMTPEQAAAIKQIAEKLAKQPDITDWESNKLITMVTPQ